MMHMRHCRPFNASSMTWLHYRIHLGHIWRQMQSWGYLAFGQGPGNNYKLGQGELNILDPKTASMYSSIFGTGKASGFVTLLSLR